MGYMTVSALIDGKKHKPPTEDELEVFEQADDSEASFKSQKSKGKSQK